MVEHTQTIRWLLPADCLSVFDHFVGLAFKGLHVIVFVYNGIKQSLFYLEKMNKREIKLMSTCLMKICVSDVDSTLKLKGKITVANSDLSIVAFLETTNLDASRKR